MIKILKRLWVIYYYLWFAMVFFAFYIPFLFLLSNEKYYLLANRLRGLGSQILFLMSGVFWEISFEKKLSKKQTYIFCSNHASHLDIPLFILILRGFNFAFMGKNELAKIPFFNIFFKTIDIPVDRKSRTKSHNALIQAEQYLEKGVNLVIFPEGTSSEIAPTLLKFKNGAFKLAIEKQVPIVPVTMLDNWKLFLDDLKYKGKPGKTRAIVHQPIETNGMTMENLEELKAEVFGVIDLTLKKEYESR